MSENRKCVNCRHNIRKEKPSGNIECVCEITNEHIGYVKCFEGWCKHWAKQKIDGELLERGKLFIHGDTEPELIIDTKGETTVDIEAMKKYFEDMVRKNERK